MPAQRVTAYVYDISQGMARGMSQALVGKQVDIIPHTGIIVFGKEVFFGSGVCVSAAGQAIPMQPCERIDLGETEKSEAELMEWLRGDISVRYQPEKYNLLTHNCNHFASEVSEWLVGRILILFFFADHRVRTLSPNLLGAF